MMRKFCFALVCVMLASGASAIACREKELDTGSQ
jgi:hypothetical protein